MLKSYAIQICMYQTKKKIWEKNIRKISNVGLSLFYFLHKKYRILGLEKERELWQLISQNLPEHLVNIC